MIERNGGGYRVQVRQLAPDKEEPVSVARADAPDKAQVLGAVARVAEDLREALGDTTPSSTQQKETFTAASLEAVRAYTEAQDLSTSQRDVEAAEKYREALRHDPEFGRAYSGLGASLFRMGNRDEAEKNWNEALRRTDRMTEREKLRTFGGYYIAIARNTDKAIETYEQLVEKYPADSAGYNNLAIAYFNTLNFAKALEYGRKAIDIYPKTFKYRSNYALYAMYAGDFKTAAATAQELIKEDPKVDVPYLPLAMEAVAAGDIPRARTMYEQVKQAGDSGVSLSALGLADIAMYEGRYDEAIAILPAAAKRDQDQQNILGAVSKLVALAEAYQARGNDPARLTAIAQARALSTQENVLVPAARLSIHAGRIDDAQKIAAELGQRLSAQSRAYGKMIDGEIAINAKQYVEALDALNAAQKHADLWLVRFALGLAYFNHGALSRGRLGIREMPRAARRGDGGVPRRPADRSLLRDPALLARARARDAEARRALAVPGVPADSSGRHRRSAGRGRAAPDRIRRALIFLRVPPRPRTIGERCASAGYRHRHRPGGSRDDSRDGRDDGRDSGSERIEFDASTRHRRRRLR